MCLNPVTQLEIFNYILGFSNFGSMGADGLAPKIINANAALLCDHYVHIFNVSFTRGIFPGLAEKSFSFQVMNLVSALIQIIIDQLLF